MQANGDIIYHAGTTVYLTESVDGTYCAPIEENNVEYDLMLKQWTEEEE